MNCPDSSSSEDDSDEEGEDVEVDRLPRGFAIRGSNRVGMTEEAKLYVRESTARCFKEGIRADAANILGEMEQLKKDDKRIFPPNALPSKSQVQAQITSKLAELKQDVVDEDAEYDQEMSRDVETAVNGRRLEIFAGDDEDEDGEEMEEDEEEQEKLEKRKKRKIRTKKDEKQEDLDAPCKRRKDSQN